MSFQLWSDQKKREKDDCDGLMFPAASWLNLKCHARSMPSTGRRQCRPTARPSRLIFKGKRYRIMKCLRAPTHCIVYSIPKSFEIITTSMMIETAAAAVVIRSLIVLCLVLPVGSVYHWSSVPCLVLRYDVQCDAMRWEKRGFISPIEYYYYRTVFNTVIPSLLSFFIGPCAPACASPTDVT